MRKPSRPRSLPATANSKLESSSEDYVSPEKHLVYRSIVGKINYLAVVARPDLAFVVSSLSQFLSRPLESHLIAAKHVLRYVKDTVDLSVTFRKSECLEILANSDSDWAASSPDRRSGSQFTGYCIRLAENSSIVSWCTREQPTVVFNGS